MGILRTVDRAEVAMDVLVHTSASQVFDDEARRLGARIIPIRRTGNVVAYARALRRALREHGPYDAVHSHVAYFSGVVLAVAAIERIPIRIAHSHTDRRSIEGVAGLPRRVYTGTMRQLIHRVATLELANSEQSGRSLFGDSWAARADRLVLPYGVPLDRFRAVVDDAPERRRGLRTELGLPEDAFVVGHVGRFIDVKNHRFVLQMFRHVATADPDARLLLVGDGPLRPEIERGAVDAGLADRVVFAGIRSDVPELMRDAIDVIVLPSHYEGFGLVIVEATASGTPAVISDVVPVEVDVVAALVHRLPLSDSAEAWATGIIKARSVPVGPREALAAVEHSPFEMTNAARALIGHYGLGEPSPYA